MVVLDGPTGNRRPRQERVKAIGIWTGVASPLSQRLVLRVGTTRTVAAALGTVAVLFAALSLAQPGTSYWLVGSALLLIGAGVGTARRGVEPPS